MPRLEYFLAAESVAVDQLTNRVSVFNILELFDGSSLPATVPDLVCVACLLADQGDLDKDFQASVRLSGAPLEKEEELPMNFSFASETQRLTHRLKGLRLVRPGRLVFTLVVNGQALASHSVTVRDRPREDP